MEDRGFYPDRNTDHVETEDLDAIAQDALYLARQKAVSGFVTRGRHGSVNTVQGRNAALNASSGLLTTPHNRIMQDMNATGARAYGRIERGGEETNEPVPEDIYKHASFDTRRAAQQAVNGMSGQMREQGRENMTEWGSGDVMSSGMPISDLYRPFDPAPLVHDNRDTHLTRTTNGASDVEFGRSMPRESIGSSRRNVGIENGRDEYATTDKNFSDTTVHHREQRDTTLKGMRGHGTDRVSNALTMFEPQPQRDVSIRVPDEYVIPNTMGNAFCESGFVPQISRHFLGSENIAREVEVAADTRADFTQELTRDLKRVHIDGVRIPTNYNFPSERHVTLREESVNVGDRLYDHVQRKVLYGESDMIQTPSRDVRIDDNRRQISELSSRDVWSTGQYAPERTGNETFDRRVFAAGVPDISR